MNQTTYFGAVPSEIVNDRVRAGAVVVVVLVVVGGVGLAFSLDTGAESPEPAEFDDTVTVGLTLDEELALEEDVELPRAQAFYSQYEYVVGYYGVETFVDAADQPGHQQRFGYPLAVYVTDYSGVGVALNEEGHPVADRPPGWAAAEDAWYVVDSDARTPVGETVVPFGERADAEAFADEYGGEVVTWETVSERSFELDDAAVVRDRVDEQQAEADEMVAAADAHDERPVSVVVGEDADTVQEGIDEAPANTTVLVPEGTYEETLEIDHPITLAGEGEVTIRGDGEGSVITITEPEVGVRNLDITGVGPQIRDADEVPGEDELGDTFQTNYAGTDAGVSAHVADGVSVVDVRVETPSNGVILRESPGAVVKNVTVEGNEDPREGFAGVMVFRSPGVIEDSTIIDGRDTVYLYRSEGHVVRDNEIGGSVLGIHLMYNDGALLADNEMENFDNTGIYIMTGPERNAVVGNEVRGAPTGAYVGGSDSYFAGNVFEANDRGIRMETEGSIYEYNVLAGNELGIEDAAILPTNQVYGNDFVANDEHAAVWAGPLRIWTHDGVGNYWQDGVSVIDGTPPERSYSPTDPVDARLHDTDGAATLARAPALDALAGLEQSVPGMQTESITDLDPACEPHNPELVDRTAHADEARHCDGTSPAT